MREYPLAYSNIYMPYWVPSFLKRKSYSNIQSDEEYEELLNQLKNEFYLIHKK